MAMKKLYTLLLPLVALLATSCSENFTEQPVLDSSSIEFFVDFGDSRINFTDQNIYSWEGNETLGAYIDSTTPLVNIHAPVHLEDSRAKCRIANCNFSNGDMLSVYYPWNELNDANTIGAVSLTIPVAQKQAVAGEFTVENMPMVSSATALTHGATNPTVYMRPLAGFIRANIYSSTAYTSEHVLSVSYSDSKNPMSGNFSVDISKVHSSGDIEVGPCDNHSVTLSVAEPYAVKNSREATKPLYMVLAPGKYQGQLTITTDKAIYSYTYNSTVARNIYYDLNIDLDKATSRRSIDSEWGGGNGSAENPYLISKATDLKLLAELVNNSQSYDSYNSKHYRQICDIDLSATPLTAIGASASLIFTGSYDGGGFTLSNATISPATSGEPCGLFGYALNAEIKNITVKDFNINSTAYYQSALVGWADECTISNCTIKGLVNLYSLYSGGFAGYMSGGVVKDCLIDGRVENNVKGISLGSETNVGYTGGCVGHAANGALIERCTISGDVAVMGRYAAGVVARLEESTVRECSILSTAEISNVSHYCGGIAAIMIGNSALIEKCHFEGRLNSGYTITGGIVGSIKSGKVSGCIATATSSVADDQNNVGGIAGEIMTINATDIALIDCCAFYGQVEGAHSVGGIVGYIAHTSDGAYAGVTNCATIGGKVISKGAYNKKYNLVGGVVGWITKSVGTTVVASCAGRAGSIHAAPISELVATKELISGLVACVDNKKGSTTLYGCYTDATRSNVFIGFEPISTNNGLHGALFGYSYYNVTLTSCYYNDSLGIHGSVGNNYTCTESGCQAFTIPQMTDGSLLSALNAAAKAYVPYPGTPEAQQWIADANGYPIPNSLPIDTTPIQAAPKRVSVIGDSISTFRGYIPYKYSTYYPRADGTFLSVEDMYWYRLIYKHMTNARLERNIAYSGSLVTNSDASATTYFAKRFIDQNGVGDADIVIIHGGTNDWNRNAVELAPGVGIRNSSAPSDSQLSQLFAAADAATSRTQIESLNDTTFCEAYIKLIKLVIERNPDVKIICLIGDYVGEGVQLATHKMAAHFPKNARCVDLRAVGGFNDLETNQSNMPKLYYDAQSNPNQCHPNQKAMAFMADKIYNELGEWLEN